MISATIIMKNQSFIRAHNFPQYQQDRNIYQYLITLTFKQYNFIFFIAQHRMMKLQTPDENIQLLLKQYQIDQPKRKCGSGHSISNICINPTCDSQAMYCEQKNCNSCYKNHIICQRISLDSLTFLSQKHAQRHREFIIKVLQIQNSLIQQIQKRRKNIIQKLYLGDLQPKYRKVIESIYIKKQLEFEFKGKLADQTFRVLKKTTKQAVDPERLQLLQTFKVQVQNLIKHLNDKQNKLIEQYLTQFKARAEGNIFEGSTIITKDNKEYLQFLQQSFLGARKFKLIFRASQNGFSAAKFHQHCDNIKHTFTLIKTQFGKTIGGYTPMKWNEGTNVFIADKQGLGFLLSFDLRHKMKLIQPNRAIFNNPNFGPIFGSGRDISITDKCNQHYSFSNFPQSYNCYGKYSQDQQSYTAFVGAVKGYDFKVNEYEVYQVFW